MRQPKTILVVGGQGAVGQAAVTQLSQRGYRVITAGRREHPNHPHHIVFDLFDHKALADSCRQVDLVLNAAGPASDIEAHIALTALAEGKHYVDVAGDPVIEQTLLVPMAASSSACVLGAGFIPGLAAMLPRYAVDCLSPVTQLTVYSGGIETFTPTSAHDFLSSQYTGRAQGKSGYVWYDGGLCKESMKKAVSIPTAQRLFDALPYFSFEHERLVTVHSLSHLAAYNLIADQRLLVGLGGEGGAAAQTLIAFSQQLTRQEGEQQHLFMVAKGLLAGQPAALQLQIRFTNSYQLTGTIAALAAHHVLCTHRVGLYWLTDLLPIKVLLSQLNELALFSHFHIHCQLDNNAVNFQEGAL
ncbi:MULTISPECIES: NAD-dependent epimerase/dehydratase family protein [Yersinia pseudotuberculosis complex]|uniref:Saccharopine dehydrogenase n=1 Tax=Yersinia pseudotuberculosis serotype O:1b (strain IP 31758) TaxID=349747 RepID=A0A0U1QZM1_YERP3|nr:MULTISPECIES: NAD-dependent epimerase/dehydratase family protein [Yersinia pseudotuberculosis complex]ABS48257.1 saccharopine dehydrogenase [Yersinia pseudotuberculosis IP 31758]AIN16150.1 NAD dependent epimerase/dehydratase family protein [Yersinia pseudotuberculosis]AJJ08138.1 NAD dependent epimerase/dehydratase family protein [Yersinia pseudotuberculosis]MBO1555891.1 NAD-dependent epimerase/dehydratase family protein [Yersinia pseudotuberculosis]MBO1562841.1 NAD-dependent epimerase/dehyd